MKIINLLTTFLQNINVNKFNEVNGYFRNLHLVSPSHLLCVQMVL
jgi:hypothetical protein